MELREHLIGGKTLQNKCETYHFNDVITLLYNVFRCDVKNKLNRFTDRSSNFK